MPPACRTGCSTFEPDVEQAVLHSGGCRTGGLHTGDVDWAVLYSARGVHSGRPPLIREHAPDHLLALLLWPTLPTVMEGPVHRERLGWSNNITQCYKGSYNYIDWLGRSNIIFTGEENVYL